MNIYDREVHDRDELLGALVADDRWATAALQRGDDLALLRRVAKVRSEALGLAVERALMRGGGDVPVRRAAGLDVEQMRQFRRDIWFGRGR